MPLSGLESSMLPLSYFPRHQTDTDYSIHVIFSMCNICALKHELAQRCKLQSLEQVHASMHMNEVN